MAKAWNYTISSLSFSQFVTFCLYVYACNTALYGTSVPLLGLREYLLPWHVSTPDDTTGVQKKKNLAVWINAINKNVKNDWSIKRNFIHRPYFLKWRSIHRHTICVTSTVVATETVGVRDVLCSFLFLSLKNPPVF
jgi:hypothetical protein